MNLAMRAKSHALQHSPVNAFDVGNAYLRPIGDADHAVGIVGQNKLTRILAHDAS
jgi:hypothetical protein